MTGRYPASPFYRPTHSMKGNRGLPQRFHRALPIAVTVLLTVIINDAIRGRPAPSQPHPGPGYSLEDDDDDDSGWRIHDMHHTERWQMPDEWRKSIVFATPISPAGLDWVKASRSWRRGTRAAFVGDVIPSAQMILDSGVHGEEFVFLNASQLPFNYYGKAAMVPSVAHEHFGEYNYKWMLYGDDDTVWFMDRVIDIIKKLDPDLPWFISDHMWFWGYEDAIYKKVNHPAADAPRCVPCGFDKSAINKEKVGFDPPEACPYCTWDLLCQHDTSRKSLYEQPEREGEPCSFKRKYPQDGEYLVHGGGGIILSVGLMRMLPISYLETCIKEKFKPSQVFGGDTLFGHCTFMQNIAPTDPGYYFVDPPYNTFDQGGQLVLPVYDAMYKYLKKGCCDEECSNRVGNVTTVHMRGLHFKEPEAAMDMARNLVRMREMYLHVREKAIVNGGHPELEPGWDIHKACF